MKKTINLFMLCGLFFNCNAQQGQWAYKHVPADYVHTTSGSSGYDYKTVDSGQEFDLTSSLPAGYVKDGSVDYTRYLQNGINAHQNVIFPNFPVLIKQNGLSLISNSKIIFKSLSKIILQPNSSPSYTVLSIQNVNNVVVYSPVIIGDRDKHGGTTGQWGMGISIRGAENVKIINPKISNCWGDGIYIGSASNTPSQNVVIQNALLDNNRRNGISIVSGKNIQILNSLVSNTNGQSPMAGIDIEPNNNHDVLEHIVIQKLISFNNKAFGIMIFPGSMRGAALKNIDISINNHTDDGSGTGLSMLLERPRSPLPGHQLMGNINIINPIWKNNLSGGFKKSATPNTQIKVSIQNPFISKNINGKEIQDMQGETLMKKTMAADKNFIR